MTINQQILDHINNLFDIVGVSRLSDTENLLILGLESTAERNLDDFGHQDGSFHLYGFEKHIAPRLDSLVDFIHSKGFSAEPLSRLGYPLQGEVNLKEHAIRTGLGKRGKNTIVLHPEYGTRLRFAGVRTDAPLDSTADRDLTEGDNPVCQDCTICIDVCPTDVLEPYHLFDIPHCLSNISPRTAEGRSILCDECIKQCPANTV